MFVKIRIYKFDVGILYLSLYLYPQQLSMSKKKSSSKEYCIIYRENPEWLTGYWNHKTLFLFAKIYFSFAIKHRILVFDSIWRLLEWRLVFLNLKFSNTCTFCLGKTISMLTASKIHLSTDWLIINNLTNSALIRPCRKIKLPCLHQWI